MPSMFGDLRVGPDPDAVVDDAADVLGELAVEGRPDRADRLVKKDCDRKVRRLSIASSHDARAGGGRGDSRSADCQLADRSSSVEPCLHRIRNRVFHSNRSIPVERPWWSTVGP